MPNNLTNHYKLDFARYQHYYRQVYKFYEKPITKVSTALLLTIFTIIFFAIFAIKPTLTTIAELVKKIDDQEVVLEKLEQKSASLATAQREYSLAQANLQQLEAAIPTDKDLQSLIDQIEATVAYHRLAIDSLDIGDATFERSSSNEDDNLEIPIKISLTADYPQLKQLLLDLIEIPRFVIVDSVGISLPEESRRGNTTNTTQMLMQITALYMPL